MQLVRALATLVLSLAGAGLTMLLASFALSAAHQARYAELAFSSSTVLLGMFGVPALNITANRVRERQLAALRAHVDAHGRALFRRYVALTGPGADEHEAAMNWRREIERFRRSMKHRPWLLTLEESNAAITERVLAIGARRRRKLVEREVQHMVSITLPRRVENELCALGWRAQASNGPDLLGPIVRASKASVKVVLRCERGLLTMERVERALTLRKHFQADIGGIVCTGAISTDARLLAARHKIILLSPDNLRAMYPAARAIWKTRKAADAVETNRRPRAQAARR